jgi:anti-sigma regulatory factor (Ser/Thr protein kinase)
MRPESAQAARRRVRETLELFDADPAVIDDAELLTSEVVTNGLVHAARPGAELRLLLFRDGDLLTVEVHDPSRALPHPLGSPDPLSESGRGLFLVTRLAVDHGAHLAEGRGKVVWFQVSAWPARAEADTAPPEAIPAALSPANTCKITADPDHGRGLARPEHRGDHGG